MNALKSLSILQTLVITLALGLSGCGQRRPFEGWFKGTISKGQAGEGIVVVLTENSGTVSGYYYTPSGSSGDISGSASGNTISKFTVSAQAGTCFGNLSGTASVSSGGILTAIVSGSTSCGETVSASISATQQTAGATDALPSATPTPQATPTYAPITICAVCSGSAGDFNVCVGSATDPLTVIPTSLPAVGLSYNIAFTDSQNMARILVNGALLSLNQQSDIYSQYRSYLSGSSSISISEDGNSTQCPVMAKFK